MDEIIGANAFDVPRSWVAQVVQDTRSYTAYLTRKRERFAAQFIPPLSVRCVVTRHRDVAEREKLAAAEKDIDDRIAEMAANVAAILASSTRSCRKLGGLKS